MAIVRGVSHPVQESRLFSGGVVWRETEGPKMDSKQVRYWVTDRIGPIEQLRGMWYKKELTCKHLGYRFVIAIQQG
jgi:hypothetical protein